MKFVTVVGARPQFIKLALLSKRLREKHKEVLIHTGQHYNRGLSDVFFKDLKLARPDFNLNIGSGPHGIQMARMIEGIERVLLRENPDAVIVYGDTNSTLAGAISAAKLSIPVVHVEAGLRSFRKDMPEEVNRVITDHLSTLLFCPTLNAVTNLKREGITSGVYNVGDIMYESLGHYLGLAEKGAGVLDALGLEKKGYYLATVHRAENTDSPKRLRRIIAMLSGLGFPIIFPLHPRTKKALKNFSISLPIYSRIRFIRPVGYFDMLLLQKHARAVITDSGGVQKESYFLDTPCITLRRETEWIETLQGNGNTLVDVDRKAFMRAVKRYAGLKLKNNKAAFAKRGISGRIIGILEKELNG